MRRILIIAIVSLALGVIPGLTAPALSVEPEAVGLSVTGSEDQIRHGVGFVPGPIDRAEPVAPGAGGVGAWWSPLGDVERIESAPAAREVLALVCTEPTMRRRTIPVGLRAPDSGGVSDVLDALTL